MHAGDVGGGGGSTWDISKLVNTVGGWTLFTLLYRLDALHVGAERQKAAGLLLCNHTKNTAAPVTSHHCTVKKGCSYNQLKPMHNFFTWCPTSLHGWCHALSYATTHLQLHSPWYNCTGWMGVKHQLTYWDFTPSQVWCLAPSRLWCLAPALSVATPDHG